MSEQLYKLKDEVKKYFPKRLHDSVMDLNGWSVLAELEALEPVPNRVELTVRSYSKHFAEMGLFKSTEIDWTEQERLLCEQALNGELFTMDDIEYIGSKVRVNSTTKVSSIINKWLKTRNTQQQPKQ